MSKDPEERRIGQPAVPADIKFRLTDSQKAVLVRMQGFGWDIEFVRRPLFQDVVVVLKDPSGDRHAVLTEDGELDYDHDVTIR